MNLKNPSLQNNLIEQVIVILLAHHHAIKICLGWVRGGVDRQEMGLVCAFTFSIVAKVRAVITINILEMFIYPLALNL